MTRNVIAWPRRVPLERQGEASRVWAAPGLRVTQCHEPGAAVEQWAATVNPAHPDNPCEWGIRRYGATPEEAMALADSACREERQYLFRREQAAIAAQYEDDGDDDDE